MNSYALGAPFLARKGLRIGRQIKRAGGRVVSNGGNCRFPDVNWVHYVHAIYHPFLPASWMRRMKQRVELPMNRRAEKAALRGSRLVICNSQSTRRAVVEQIGVEESKTAVVYYGSDSTIFRPATEDERVELRHKFGWPCDRPVVIFVGALGDRRKGFDTLFDAWIRLSKKAAWNALLVVVGRGVELPIWQARANAAGLGEQIRFLGFRTDVPDLLHAANLLVAPTRYEAYGLGVHEALCCGIPAITSASAGVAEQYPGDASDLLL
ncbi:MAG: glycosyltransferase family 4 protein, partial [Planctomycetes bacterium]|nr:glycosyltransferase family 4 protein [Planctomycetota bacterium]